MRANTYTYSAKFTFRSGGEYITEYFDAEARDSDAGLEKMMGLLLEAYPDATNIHHNGLTEGDGSYDEEQGWNLNFDNDFFTDTIDA